jgi:hypothetical protein
MKKSVLISVCFFLLLMSCGKQDHQAADSTAIVRGTDSLIKKSDSTKQQPVIATADSIIPCVFSKPDTSIYNMILDDMESTVKQVGEESGMIETNEELPYRLFVSNNKRQQLKLIYHYGRSKNEFAEVEVSANPATAQVTTLNTNTFITGRGIKLGMTEAEIIAVLGSCYKIISGDKASELIKYTIDDDEHSDFLHRFNYPLYYAEYEFEGNRLIRFKFGFEYP